MEDQPRSLSALVFQTLKMAAEWPPDSLVWAKIPGTGWWPCKVEKLENLPEPFRETKLPENQKFYPVYCFGSYEYRWAHENLIKSFKTHFTSYNNRSDSSSFQTALKECIDVESALSLQDATEVVGVESTTIKEHNESQSLSTSVLPSNETQSAEFGKQLLNNDKNEKMSSIHDQLQYLLNAPIPLLDGQSTHNSQHNNAFFSFDPMMNPTNDSAGADKFTDSQSTTRFESLESPFAFSSQYQNFENISTPLGSRNQEISIAASIEMPNEPLKITSNQSADDVEPSAIDWKTLIADKIGFDMKNVHFQKRLHFAKGIKHFLLESGSNLVKDTQRHAYLIPSDVQDDFVEWFKLYEANNWVFEDIPVPKKRVKLQYPSYTKEIAEGLVDAVPKEMINTVREETITPIGQEYGPEKPVFNHQTRKISLKIPSVSNIANTVPSSSKWDPKLDEIVWAKSTDLHWWPAKIEEPHAFPMDPEETPTDSYLYKPVYFFGSHEYAWVRKTDVLEFEKNFDMLSGKCTLKKFKIGLQECYDPDSWPSREYASQTKNEKKSKTSSSKLAKRNTKQSSDGVPPSTKVKSKKSSAQKKKKTREIEKDWSDYEDYSQIELKFTPSYSSKKKSSAASSFSKKGLSLSNQPVKNLPLKPKESVSKEKDDSLKTILFDSQNHLQPPALSKSISDQRITIPKQKEFATPKTNITPVETNNHSPYFHQNSSISSINIEEDRHREKIRKIEIEQARTNLRQAQAQAKLEIITSMAIARQKLRDSGVPESEINILLQDFPA